MCTFSFGGPAPVVYRQEHLSEGVSCMVRPCTEKRRREMSRCERLRSKHLPWQGTGNPFLGRFIGQENLCFRSILVVDNQSHLSAHGAGANGPNRPVLKHGPRSSTCMQAFEWQTQAQRESEGGYQNHCGEKGVKTPHHHPRAGRPHGRKSMPAETRKTANYACAGRSQGKPWWRLVAVLTCESLAGHGYRGERLIERSSSWFPSKFPAG